MNSSQWISDSIARDILLVCISSLLVILQEVILRNLNHNTTRTNESKKAVDFLHVCVDETKQIVLANQKILMDFIKDKNASIHLHSKNQYDSVKGSNLGDSEENSSK